MDDGKKKKYKTRQPSQTGQICNVFMFLSMHDSDILDGKKTCFLHDIEWEAIYKLYPEEQSIVMSAYKA